MNSTTNASGGVSEWLPVQKNNVVRISYGNMSSFHAFNFVYAEGDQ